MKEATGAAASRAAMLKSVALCALVIQTTSAVILTRQSKILKDPNDPDYYSTTLVVMAELSKLGLSLLFVFLFDVTPNDHLLDAPIGDKLADRWARFKVIIYDENFANPMETVKLCVPAALYTLQNNLIYVALANLEATTFQVGYQSKVITTAVLSVIMLQRRLAFMKWVAIVGLTTGIVLTQLDSSKKKTDNSSTEQSFALGLFAVVVCAFSSAFAGVYFEKILKGSAPSIWIRNTQLAFFASCLGFGGVIAVDGLFIDFFRGYNLLTWSIVFVQAAGGLIVAVVVKYADNILKGFATALSIILCGLLSMHMFGFRPSVEFMFGSVVVIGSTFLYSMKDPPASKPGPSPVSPVAYTPQTISPTGTFSERERENVPLSASSQDKTN